MLRALWQVLNSTYDAKLPAAYTDWVEEDAFNWARLDWSSVVLPSDCSPLASMGSSFKAWLLIKGLTPLIVLLLAIVVSCIVSCKMMGCSRANCLAGVVKALPLTLVVSFLFVPTITMNIFQSWLCLSYVFDDTAINEVSSQSYLRYDLRVRCSDGGFRGAEHETIKSIATTLACFWPVGMTGVYGASLFACRVSLRARQHTPLVRATTFLHHDYKIDFYYWELIELARRNILVGWLLLIDTEKDFLRLVCAMILSIVSLTLLLAAGPYARAEDNLLAGACQLTLVFSFFGSTLIRLFEAFGEASVPHAVVQRVMVFSSSTVIATPLIAITLAMNAVIFFIMINVIRKEGHQPVLRLVATGVPPELTLDAGHKWHLFLSHVVSFAVAACYADYPQYSQLLSRVRYSGQQVKMPTPSSSGNCSGY